MADIKNVTNAGNAKVTRGCEDLAPLDRPWFFFICR